MSGRRVWRHSEEEKLSWLRQILEWQRDMSDNREFLNLIKGDLDLFAEDVYCFTPQGDVKESAERFYTDRFRLCDSQCSR